MFSVLAAPSKRSGCAPGAELKQLVIEKQYDNRKLGVETKCPELNKLDWAIFSSAPRVVAGTFVPLQLEENEQSCPSVNSDHN